ncbi:MAG: hypothetical protein KDA16_14200, partial [Phycisphaerales bacterium]|nr:hypothetical protein [Phycisphaerales bacterium]
AFSGDTNPDGAEVTIYGATLYINGDNSTLRGFDTCAIQLTGSNGIIEDCTGTMNITVFGGSGSTIRNNTGGTIKIDRSNDNIIIGNTVTRVRVLGWVGGGLPATNNRVGGPALADRNYITGYGTHDGEGYPSGSTIQIFDATDTLIENNWIGTTPDGLSSGSNASTAGIGFEGENHDTTIINNRIAGILGIGQGPHAVGYIAGSAIRIYGNGDGITIQGNTIG